MIAVVTTAYTIFSFLQWSAMKDALIRTDSSNVLTRESIEIAKQNLIHSESANAKSFQLVSRHL